MATAVVQTVWKDRTLGLHPKDTLIQHQNNQSFYQSPHCARISRRDGGRLVSSGYFWGGKAREERT